MFAPAIDAVVTVPGPIKAAAIIKPVMPDFMSFPLQRLFYFLVIVVFYASLTLSSTALILLASPSHFLI
jgi:hypothetical protein